MSDAPRSCCLLCEPDADPLTDLLEVIHCSRHWPSSAGLDDAGVTFAEVTTAETDNLAWCALIHRDRAESEVPMDYAPPLIADGTFVAVAREGTLPPLDWDYWE